MFVHLIRNKTIFSHIKCNLHTWDNHVCKGDKTSGEAYNSHHRVNYTHVSCMLRLQYNNDELQKLLH